MTTHAVVLRVEVLVEVPEGSDAISRYVGLSPEKGKAKCTAPGLDESVVLLTLARMAVYGIEDASQLDGWGDLPEGSVTMRIDDISEADY